MLTTRCPHCHTTFRITSAALHKAAGQVRCGQCSSVFSAFDSLADTQTHLAVDERLQSTVTEPEAAFELPAHSETEPPEAAADAHEAADADAIPPQQVFEVLEDPGRQPQIPWHPVEREPAPEPRGWRIAAACAAIALLGQGIHYFRGAIAGLPVAGAAIQRLYTAAGRPIVEDVDPANFMIVDWVATAQAGAEDDAAGSLEISAGVRNTSGAPLPYPLLSLELTDRWEEIIGARVFTPADYTGHRVSSNARIGPQATVQAHLQLVDPGPDAYGFEVDICVAVDNELLRCRNDAVFR